MGRPAASAELASLLRVPVMRLARRLRQQRADSTLTLTQLATLATLDRHGRCTPRELADLERVQPPSMTRCLATLEELGLVDRSPHPTDGRAQLVSLTSAARQRIAEDRRRKDAWLARRLAELSAEERDVLARAAAILDRLAGAED